jgi:hypothetical protein
MRLGNGDFVSFQGCVESQGLDYVCKSRIQKRDGSGF